MIYPISANSDGVFHHVFCVALLLLFFLLLSSSPIRSVGLLCLLGKVVGRWLGSGLYKVLARSDEGHSFDQ